LTKFEVLVSEIAINQLNSLETTIKNRIIKNMKQLLENPFEKRPNADIKQLSGLRKRTFYRLRAGDYRIIYSIDSNKVKITEVLHRKNAYKWLD